jgi:hypothetical protein
VKIKKTMTENKWPVRLDGLCRPNDLTLKYLGLAAAHTRDTHDDLLFRCSGRAVLQIDDLMLRQLLVYYCIIIYSYYFTATDTKRFCLYNKIYIYVCVRWWRYLCPVFTRSIDRWVDVSIVNTATYASLVFNVLYTL